jgi:cytidine deaminase
MGGEHSEPPRRRLSPRCSVVRVPPSRELEDRLVAAATAVRANAYVPASGFRVGAALRTRDGREFAGCNVENASYGLTICAERAAVFAAVAGGATVIDALAVVTDTSPPARPCGACLQVLAEFGRGMAVVLAGSGGVREVTTLAALLPQPFTFGDGGPHGG